MGNNCEDKIKFSCPPGLFAKCVKIELTPPIFSTLLTQCNSIEEVDIDQYILIGGIKSEIDLTTVTSACQTLPTTKNVKTLIQFLLNRDCAQQAQIEALTTRVLTLETKVTALEANPCN